MKQDELYERNSIFKDKHIGQRCFIICTGESLKTQDLSPLECEVTFAVNNFIAHPIVNCWEPDYYCLADPMVFNITDSLREFFSEVNKKIHESIFFLPDYGADQFQQQNVLPIDRTFFIPTQGALANQKITNIDVANDYIGGVQSVSQLPIMIAIYMGCNPIYLMGFDHDWLSHRGYDKHFYDLEQPYHLSQQPYKVGMQCQLALWEGYEKLLEYTNQKNMHIINLTNGGFLDVFPREKYENVVDQHLSMEIDKTGPKICPTCSNMTYIFDYGDWFCPVCKIDSILDDNSDNPNSTPNTLDRFPVICPNCDGTIYIDKKGKWNCPYCNKPFTH